MRNVRQFCKSLYNQYVCKKNQAPGNCDFSVHANIKNCKFEGRNKINRDARISNCDIGFGTYIAQNSKFSNCKIGRYSLVGFESLIGGHPIHDIPSVHPAFYSTRGQYGFTYVQENYFEEYTYADPKNKYSIVIGNDVWVTAGSTKIIQGVTIGDGAVVMADAVVTKNVPPYAIVGGIPAKIIGYRFTEEQIAFLLKLKWWDRGEKWISEHIQYYRNIELLMNKVIEEEPDLMKEGFNEKNID